MATSSIPGAPVILSVILLVIQREIEIFLPLTFRVNTIGLFSVLFTSCCWTNNESKTQNLDSLAVKPGIMSRVKSRTPASHSQIFICQKMRPVGYAAANVCQRLLALFYITVFRSVVLLMDGGITFAATHKYSWTHCTTAFYRRIWPQLAYSRLVRLPCKNIL